MKELSFHSLTNILTLYLCLIGTTQILSDDTSIYEPVPSIASLGIPDGISARPTIISQEKITGFGSSARPFVNEIMAPSCHGGFCLHSLINLATPAVKTANVKAVLNAIPPSYSIPEIPPSINSNLPPNVQNQIPPNRVAAPGSPGAAALFCPVPFTKYNGSLAIGGFQVTEIIGNANATDFSIITTQQAFARALQCVVNGPAAVRPVQPRDFTILTSTPTTVTIMYTVLYLFPINEKVNINDQLNLYYTNITTQLNKNIKNGNLIVTTVSNCLLGFGTPCLLSATSNDLPILTPPMLVQALYDPSIVITNPLLPDLPPPPENMEPPVISESPVNDPQTTISTDTTTTDAPETTDPSALDHIQPVVTTEPIDNTDDEVKQFHLPPQSSSSSSEEEESNEPHDVIPTMITTYSPTVEMSMTSQDNRSLPNVMDFGPPYLSNTLNMVTLPPVPIPNPYDPVHNILSGVTSPPLIKLPDVTLPPVPGAGSLPGVTLPPVPGAGSLPVVTLPPVPGAGSLPGVTLPPVPEAGSLPVVTLPPVPGAGSLPGVTLPPVPGAGSLPGVTLPPLPDVTLPPVPGAGSLPGVTLPPVPGAGSLPGVTLPPIPDVTLPPVPGAGSLPGVTLPPVPSVTLPPVPGAGSLPGVTLPPVPSVTLPPVPGAGSLPVVTLPPVPSVTLPPVPGAGSLPVVTLPPVPSVTLPPVPGAGSLPVVTLPPVLGAGSLPVVTLPPVPGAGSLPGVTLPPVPGAGSLPVVTLPPVPGAGSLPGVTLPPVPGAGSLPGVTLPPVPGAASLPVVTLPPVPIYTRPPIPVFTAPPIPQLGLGGFKLFPAKNNGQSESDPSTDASSTTTTTETIPVQSNGLFDSLPTIHPISLNILNPVAFPTFQPISLFQPISFPPVPSLAPIHLFTPVSLPPIPSLFTPVSLPPIPSLAPIPSLGSISIPPVPSIISTTAPPFSAFTLPPFPVFSLKPFTPYTAPPFPVFTVKPFIPYTLPPIPVFTLPPITDPLKPTTLMPIPNLFNIPTVTLPPVPTFSIPSIEDPFKALTLPPIPKLNLPPALSQTFAPIPAITSLTFPPVPDFTLPPIFKVTLPPIPVITFPPIPVVSLPPINIGVPSIATILPPAPPSISSVLSPSQGGFQVPSISSIIQPAIGNAPNLLAGLSPSISILPPSLNSLLPPSISSLIPPSLISPGSDMFLCPLKSLPNTLPLKKGIFTVNQVIDGASSSDFETVNSKLSFTRAVQCSLNGPHAINPVEVTLLDAVNKGTKSVTLSYSIQFDYPITSRALRSVDILEAAVSRMLQSSMDTYYNGLTTQLNDNIANGSLLRSIQQNCLLAYGTSCLSQASTTSVPTYSAASAVSDGTTSAPSSDANKFSSGKASGAHVPLMGIIIAVASTVALCCMVVVYTCYCRKKKDVEHEDYDEVKSSSMKSWAESEQSSIAIDMMKLSPNAAKT